MGGLSILLILGILMSMYVFFLIVLIIFIIYLCVNYIFECLFLHHVSQAKTSWIPFYKKYLLGKVANKSSQGIMLMIVDIFIFLFIVIGVFATHLPAMVNYFLFWATLILIAISFIFNIYLSHWIMKKTNNHLIDLFTVINVLTLGFSRSLILFLLKHQLSIKEIN